MSKFTIRRLVLKEMPGLVEQFKHLIGVHLDPQSASGLISAICNEMGEVKPEQLAPVINNFLRYSSQAEAAVQPPGGWFQRRYAFAMHVEYITAMGTTMLIHVQGYTDRDIQQPVVIPADKTPNEALEAELDQLTFHINGLTVLRNFIYHGPSGDQPTSMVVEDLHMHSDPDFVSIFNAGKIVEMTRPEDILTKISTLSVMQLGDQKLIDTRIALTQAPRLSTRTNVMPAAVLARVAQAYIQTINMEGVGMLTMQDRFDEARAAVREPLVFANPFLQKLMRDRSQLASQSFKFAELKAIDPTVGENTAIVVESDAFDKLVNERAYTPWDDETLETQLAYALAMGVPALMGASGLNFMHFAIKPSNGGHDYYVREAGAMSMSDTVHAMKCFQMDLFKQLMPVITDNDKLPVAFEMRADRHGLSTITLKLGADLPKHYLIPTYMDALISPVQLPATTPGGFSHLDRIAHDVNMLLDMVEDGATLVSSKEQ